MSDAENGLIGTTSVRETIAQVRFGLSQLTARNAHHEFEEMSRALARETVSRSILPATGPVAAGGDQGRDFETFTSYLAAQVGQLGRQIGISDGDGIAFACTLQAEDLGTKILADVRKIVSEGTAVDHVVYYCEANLPVSRRHGLQQTARGQHNVHLEVFDGAAISELLSQRHLYWIAQEFLHLPAAALPPAPDRPDWYESDLRRWREEDRVPTTPGDLVDLSGCIRFATFHDQAAVDLPFWIERLTAFFRAGIPAYVQQKARYEIAVAQLRGLGDLRPVDDLVRVYIAEAIRTEDPAELSDASVLLMYCVGARGRGLTGHSDEQLLVWNRQLQARVVELLAATNLAGRRCVLLDCLGWLRSQPDLVAARNEGIEYRLEPELRRLSLDDIEEMARHGLVRPVHVPIVDLSGAFDAWVEMVRILPEAPLFPVERLGQVLRISAHLLIEDSRYDEVVSAVDSRISEVTGGDAAASNARDRAMTFYEHGRLLDALREIHRARVGWFSGETSEGMVLATLMASQIYRELQLPMAGKFAAMTAARLVGTDERALFARACFKAAEADYHQAAWFSSMLIADVALRAHLLLAEDPQNWERHEHLQFAFFEFAIIRGIARAAGEPYISFVHEVLERTRSNEVLDGLLEEVGVTPWWETRGLQEIAEHVVEELGHLAFADGGQRRSLSWRALDVIWVIEFNNDYESSVVAERLAAFAQIALAELAPHDLVLLPTRVTFEIDPAPENAEVVKERRSDGEGTLWRVQLPQIGQITPESIRKAGAETLSTVMAAIADISVLPPQELIEILEVTTAGLLDKLLFGTIYDVAYRDLVTSEAFERAPRVEAPPIPASIAAVPHQANELLPAGHGRHYTPETSVELAARRYETIPSTLIATLPALRAHPPFLEVIERLRAAGWKDWHILLAVFHLAQNHRLPLRRPPRSEAEAREVFQRFTTPEGPGDAAPMNIFTEEALRGAIRFSWPSTLKAWGLEMNQNPPDMRALESLLANRYGYWTDDAPHEDPFGALT